MPINKALTTFLLFLTASSYSVFCSAQNSKKTRIRPVLPYNHATLNAPPGMVYIRGGSTTLRYNQSSTDTNSLKRVSLTAFFIDKTEITNQQYRLFTEWVIDSIAIVNYLKDDKYFLQKTKDGGKSSESSSAPAPTAPDAPASTSDTTGGVATVPATPATPDSSSSSFSMLNSDSTRKRIDWSRVNHKKIFESKDADTRSKIAPLLDENGNVRRDAFQFKFSFLKTMNNATAKEKTRKYVTETVSIYPDEKVWSEDMTNSQTELLVENYFKVSPYDDYPVVGVNWKQARAFCYWRSITASSYVNMPEFMKYYRLTYTLPSEAQWVYAASGYYDMIASNEDTTGGADSTVKSTSDTTVTPHDSAYVAAVEKAVKEKEMMKGNSDVVEAPVVKAPTDSTPIHRDDKGMLSNFKQDEGDYWEDGAALTLPVMAYAPNEFGLYNMEGNVSEWMLDAYSPSTFSFVSDLNPVLLYDADSSDAEAMHRKVVRGGSFVSNAKSLSPYYRDLELDNVAHCYIGFRCVMPAPEVLYNPVSTRKKRLKGHNVNNAVSRRK
jgi:sulfatase modifying factor 1